MGQNTDYGRPMKPFFIEIPNFWADNFWAIWGIFGQSIGTHFGTVSSLSMFSINQPLFLQKPIYLNTSDQFILLFMAAGVEFTAYQALKSRDCCYC